jgi:ABC-type Co2+ transport system permease subunit
MSKVCTGATLLLGNIIKARSGFTTLPRNGVMAESVATVHVAQFSRQSTANRLTRKTAKAVQIH